MFKVNTNFNSKPLIMHLVEHVLQSNVSAGKNSSTLHVPLEVVRVIWCTRYQILTLQKKVRFEEPSSILFSKANNLQKFR